MLNHRIRSLLFHYKKKIILQLASILFRFSVIKLSMSSSLSYPISVCSVVSFCSVKSVSVKKSSSSLKKVKSKGPKQVEIRFIPRFVQFSHNCSFIRRYSPSCKPVKLGHYSVLRPRILRLLLTLYGKMT